MTRRIANQSSTSSSPTPPSLSSWSRSGSLGNASSGYATLAAPPPREPANGGDNHLPGRRYSSSPLRDAITPLAPARNNNLFVLKYRLGQPLSFYLAHNCGYRTICSPGPAPAPEWNLDTSRVGVMESMSLVRRFSGYNPFRREIPNLQTRWNLIPGPILAFSAIRDNDGQIHRASGSKPGESANPPDSLVETY